MILVLASNTVKRLRNLKKAWNKNHHGFLDKMSIDRKILLLPGDGIGPEVILEAERVLECLNSKYSLGISIEKALLGGVAYEESGDPLPQETLEKADWSDAILLGAVGGPRWDDLPSEKKPEKGLLGIRAEYDFFANLRPAILSKYLVSASTIKKELVSDLDLLIVRELTGGIYFGEPRWLIEKNKAINTMVYDEEEIIRIGKVGFEAALKRNKKLSEKLSKNSYGLLKKTFSESQIRYKYEKLMR